MTSIRGRDFFCSWSGGKDSCLSLHRAIEDGGRPRMLLTMLREDGLRSRAHWLSPEVLQAQARSLGIPLMVRATTWEDYESEFARSIRQLKVGGIESGVFGDIDLEGHRNWVVQNCARGGVEPFMPIWGSDRNGLVKEFLEEGFKATIIAIKEGVIPPNLLGRDFDNNVVDELKSAGVDISGEEGEYHTVVTAGPIFREALAINRGAIHTHDGYSFLDVSLPP